MVNLVGTSVDTRYTAENRHEIVASRVDSVRILGQAVAACARPPRAWVQAASLAIYGDTGDRVFDEAATAGSGFSAETRVTRERALDALELPATRTVVLRIGFALGRGGGALGRLERLARLSLGGAAGNGRLFISSRTLGRGGAGIAGYRPAKEGVSGASRPRAPWPRGLVDLHLRERIGRLPGAAVELARLEPALAQ